MALSNAQYDEIMREYQAGNFTTATLHRKILKTKNSLCFQVEFGILKMMKEESVPCAKL